eukprot:SAG22_NODE_138_length_18031_cov_5.796621_13_plen_128_part_00
MEVEVCDARSAMRREARHPPLGDFELASLVLPRLSTALRGFRSNVDTIVTGILRMLLPPLSALAFPRTLGELSWLPVPVSSAGICTYSNCRYLYVQPEFEIFTKAVGDVNGVGGRARGSPYGADRVV